MPDTEFYDTFQVTGAPSGTPVSIQFTLATAVNLMGFGQGGYQTRFSDAFNQVENSYGTCRRFRCRPPPAYC